MKVKIIVTVEKELPSDLTDDEICALSQDDPPEFFNHSAWDIQRESSDE